ncbi:MAG: DUF4406 domain-containing protein [Clostridium argentinense]|nr:DUF4406 domain-containing protein [Clostridium argentinense]
MISTFLNDHFLTFLYYHLYMGKCSEVWVLGNTISSGMAREIEVAKKRRQTVRYFSPEHEEVESL